MVVNMNMHADAKGSINEYLADTIDQVFGEVCTVDVEGSTNRELFASDSPGLRARLESNRSQISDPELYQLMGKVANKLTDYAGGSHILTDDKAPVELLGMRMIDSLIQDELGYYKKQYQEGGIKGLIEAAG